MKGGEDLHCGFVIKCLIKIQKGKKLEMKRKRELRSLEKHKTKILAISGETIMQGKEPCVEIKRK